MKLYFSRGVCSLAPHILLHEIGARFELESVDLKTKKTASGADYLQINPKGYVPALALDEGELLTEAAVILQYIGDRKPELDLVGAHDTLARYRTLEWTHYVASEVHKGFSPLFAPDTPADYREIAKARLSQRLTYVDARLASGEYLLGSRFTIADVYLFVTLNWLRGAGLDAAAFPHLADFRKRMAARPAVQAAMKAEGLVK